MHRLAGPKAVSHVVVVGRIDLLPLVIHDAGVCHFARFILAASYGAALNIRSIATYIVLVGRSLEVNRDLVSPIAAIKFVAHAVLARTNSIKAALEEAEVRAADHL